jgi:hypothetical protein
LKSTSAEGGRADTYRVATWSNKISCRLVRTDFDAFGVFGFRRSAEK